MLGFACFKHNEMHEEFTFGNLYRDWELGFGMDYFVM